MDKEQKSLPQIMEQNEMITIDIPQQKIDLISNLADENVLWVKTTDGGFMVHDKVIPEITGVIVSITPYYVMWVDKKPTKIEFTGQPQPDGYELRCDLKINVAGTIIGLSLPKTSTKTHLAQYLRFLTKSGWKPNNVITRARVKVVSSPHGKFNIIIFDAVGTINDLRDAPIKTAPDISDISGMETVKPQPEQLSNNAWT